MPKKRVLFLLAALSVVASSSAHEPLQAATSTASATPANGMIAFARRVPGRDSSWTLMTINPDGTGEVAIAKDAFHPVWSPDGNELAYEVAPAGQIWVLDVDGTKRRLTAVNTRDPVWSPDGTKIAYIQYTADNGVGTLMTMNRDGSDQRPFLVGAAPVAATITAAWAPSSRLAAVAGLDCGDGIRQWGIYVLDFSGACSSAASDLEAGNPDIPLVKHLSWSPGGKLAFVYWEIEKPDGPAIRTSGPPSWRTATLPSSAGLSPNAAVWSPDGTRMAVQAGKLTDGTWVNGFSIYLTGAGGSGALSSAPCAWAVAACRLTDPAKDNAPSLAYDETPSWQPCVEGVTKICRSFHGSPWGSAVAKPPPSAAPAPLGLVCGQVAAGSDLDTDYYGSTGFRPGDTVCSLLVSNAVVKSAFLKALAATGTHIDIARFTVSMAAAIAEALRPLPKAMLDGVFKALVPQVDFSNQVTASAKALLEKALALLDPVLAVVVTAKGFVDAMVKVASVVGLVVKAKETYVALTTYNACLGLTWGVRNGETGKVNGPLPHGAGKPLPWMTSRLDQYATLRTTRRQAFWALPLECTTQGTVARSAGGRNAGIVFSRYGVALLGTLG